MIRSLFSGITGLRSHQTMMDVTGNNISNVNTVGFKGSTAVFADTLSQLLTAAGAPQDGRGGTNPAQVGLGVRVAGIATSFGQGAAQATGRSTDLMIQGDGFFVVQQNNQQMYTRAGSFTFDADGTLVGPTGAIVQGWIADPRTGAVDTNSPMADLSLGLGTLMEPKVTNNAVVGGNLPSDSTATTPLTVAMTVYDEQGAPRQLSVSFTKVSPTSWTVDATDGLATLTGQTITFDAQGRLVGPSSVTMGAGATAITIDLAGLSSYAGTATVGAQSQDGFSAGSLQGFTIGPDGSIIGGFSNGRKQTLGMVALATFNNPAGLERQGETMFSSTVNSGLAQFGTAGSGSRGTLAGGRLEMSNVDLASEFTNLIIAQRGFQANSRVITSSDELLQDLVNLKR